MKKKMIEVSVLAGFVILVLLGNKPEEPEIKTCEFEPVLCEPTVDIPVVKTLEIEDLNEQQEEIRNEIMYGELELLATLIQAEAGNQDELGKRYVADVVLNRVDSKDFPDTIPDVIIQDKQFSSLNDGNFQRAEWIITEDCYTIALEEYENRNNDEIIYFRTDRYSDYGTPAFKHGDHYFSRR